MDYRIWAVIGIALLITEMLTPTFFIVFFGAGGILTAITTWTGLTPGATEQLLVFSVSSIVLMLLFKKKLKPRLGGETIKPDYIGQRVKVVKAISKGEEGKVLYRGSDWIAFSESPEDDIPEGATVEVTGSDGLRLKVKKTA